MADYTKGLCYIIKIDSENQKDSKNILQFQFVPEKITINRNAKVGDLDIIGRNIPKYSQTGGSKDIQLKLDFFSDQEQRDDVMKKVEWLEALTFNDGPNGKQYDIIKVVFGDLFRDEVWVIKSISTEYSGFHPDFNFRPWQASVSLNLSLHSDKNFLKSQVLWRQNIN